MVTEVTFIVLFFSQNNSITEDMVREENELELLVREESRVRLLVSEEIRVKLLIKEDDSL